MSHPTPPPPTPEGGVSATPRLAGISAWVVEMNEAPALEFAPTNMPYWGFDHEIDERAERLWWLAVSLDDVSLLVKQLSSVHDVTPPRIRLDYPGRDVIAEIVDDPAVLWFVIDGIDDARYEQPSDDDTACIVFDAGLTELGNSVPVLLVVHEMAHHVEFMKTGRHSGHGDDFDEAFRDLLEQSTSILKLDSWSKSDWLSFQPTEPMGTSPSEIHATRINEMKAKWSAFLIP